MRRRGAPQPHGSAADEDFTGVGLMLAFNDARQRRLAGAVLADQRQHLAGADLERDVRSAPARRRSACRRRRRAATARCADRTLLQPSFVFKTASELSSGDQVGAHDRWSSAIGVLSLIEATSSLTAVAPCLPRIDPHRAAEAGGVPPRRSARRSGSRRCRRRSPGPASCPSSPSRERRRARRRRCRRRTPSAVRAGLAVSVVVTASMEFSIVLS